MKVETTTTLKGIERMPEPAQTYISDSMSCISDLIAEYRFALNGGQPRPIRIAIPWVKDRTSVSSKEYPDSEIPNDMTDMALGIASRIGGPVRLVHVPDSNEILDAVRIDNKPDDEKYFNGFHFSHYRSDTLILYGALTEYDRITQAREKTLDLSGEIGGGDWETTLEHSRLNGRFHARMTMDFRIVHPGIGDIVNHASSTNSVDLYQIAADRSYGISVNGNSIGYAKANSDVEARHQAIRMLVEKGIIESIAKFFFVPYWKCYPDVDSRELVRFDNYLNDSKSLHFDPLSLRQSVNILKKENSHNSAAVQDESQEQETRQQQYEDRRDEELIHALLFYFNHEEYSRNITRHHVKREQQNSELKLGENTVPVEGKQMKLKKILSLYRKNIESLNLSTDQSIYTRMYKFFLRRDLINKDDPRMDELMFLGLWLNAPVRKNARWDYL